MCLSSIKGIPKETEGEGHKVFRVDDSSHLHFEYYPPKGEGGRVKYNHWYKEESKEEIGLFGNTYSAGFHVYEDIKGGVLNSPSVRRVSYRGAHTEGCQGWDVKVIVAREILIHRKGE